MEQQVAEAALALVRPSTDTETRTAASRFLEQWTRTPESWSVYALWLQSGRSASQVDSETVGMLLLCLQLLQAKIRREVPRGTSMNQFLSSIQSELVSFLQSAVSSSVAGPACICLAALAVRCGGLADLVQSCCRPWLTQEASPIAPKLALRLLANIPLETEACSDLTNTQVTEELWPFTETVLNVVRLALGTPETTLVATETLKNWNSCCHITLTHLNTPTLGGTEAVLPVLIHLLSQSNHSDEHVIVHASRALTEAALVPNDHNTEGRTAAYQQVFQAITQSSFVVAPLKRATEMEWDDALHAISTMICTLVTEEIDELVTQPAEPLLNLLLMIQNHPVVKVRLPVLECWLTVQDVAMSSRHDNWKGPLFRQVAEGLLRTMAYPSHFVDWNQEVETDPSDFEEFRRMIKDVVVNAYFLLRSDLVQRCVDLLVHGPVWTEQEAALHSLTVTSTEICARVKSRAASTSLSHDRERTTTLLGQLLQHLVLSGAMDPSAAVRGAYQRHPLVLVGIVQWLGGFAAVWAAKCTVEDVWKLLVYLTAVLSMSRDSSQWSTTAKVKAAMSIRQILIGCSSLLLSANPAHGSNPMTHLESTVHGVTEAVLSTEIEEAMTTVAEGCTRLLMHIKDPVILSRVLASSLVGPVVRRGELALNALPPDGAANAKGLSEEGVLALDSLVQQLHVIQVIIRFCDTSRESVGPQQSPPFAEIMAEFWPFLDRVSQRAGQYEDVLDKVLAIYEQSLRTVPDLVAPLLQQMMKFVVDIFEATKHASALGYMASAVESFGASNIDYFRDLLNHTAGVTFAYLRDEKSVEDRPDLVQAFFALCQRHILYCPGALVHCPLFAGIVSCAVECLTACKGERESTRATLNFLGRLFGWRSLRVSNEVMSHLQNASQQLDEQLGQHGANIARSCMTTLLGGPQMLWPACTDCLVAVLSTAAAWPVPEDSTSNVARQWMEQAASTPESSPLYQQVVHILMRLINDGPKGRTKAKTLLTDYCKIQKGEMAPDALVSYTL